MVSNGGEGEIKVMIKFIKQVEQYILSNYQKR